MNLAQLSGLCLSLYHIICTVEVLCFFHGQVQAQFAVAIQDIVLELSFQEIVDRLLNIIFVGESQLSMGQSCWHADGPLNVIRNERLIFSAIVLQAAWSLWNYWSASFKDEISSKITC
jgi:hypothetical protein